MINLIALVALLQSTSTLVGSSTGLPNYVSAKHAITLHGWLNSNPGYRLALDTDCGCDSDIEELRKGSGGKWKPQPDYHPFYVAGDFNSDGKEDFAVILLRGAQRYIAVFNAGSMHPAYIGSSDAGSLFFGPPRPAPYRLVIGGFGSEGKVLEPHGNSYVLK
jgi:hypothetical protein